MVNKLSKEAMKIAPAIRDENINAAIDEYSESQPQVEVVKNMIERSSTIKVLQEFNLSSSNKTSTQARDDQKEAVNALNNDMHRVNRVVEHFSKNNFSQYIALNPSQGKKIVDVLLEKVNKQVRIFEQLTVPADREMFAPLLAKYHEGRAKLEELGGKLQEKIQAAEVLSNSSTPPVSRETSAELQSGPRAESMTEALPGWITKKMAEKAAQKVGAEAGTPVNTTEVSQENSSESPKGSMKI